ncbi:hypothetical protein C7389_1671 [Azoarcus indigens]|uniref:Uncharacterized protein n=2 Tax=Azoarcus indigens TaxID=29545 RepID=A0A4R6DCC1_9RHOO|nr:hypothetical protein C7389_1671 [Azoarcus indigens]
MIPVSELNYDTGQLRFASPDGKYSFEYGEGTITVTEVDAQPCGQPDLAQKAAQGRVP